jgi:hypothetical protein
MADLRWLELAPTMHSNVPEQEQATDLPPAASMTKKQRREGSQKPESAKEQYAGSRYSTIHRPQARSKIMHIHT